LWYIVALYITLYHYTTIRFTDSINPRRIEAGDELVAVNGLKSWEEPGRAFGALATVPTMSSV
jgi:hypothetical protein